MPSKKYKKILKSKEVVKQEAVYGLSRVEYPSVYEHELDLFFSLCLRKQPFALHQKICFKTIFVINF